MMVFNTSVGVISLIKVLKKLIKKKVRKNVRWILKSQTCFFHDIFTFGFFHLVHNDHITNVNDDGGKVYLSCSITHAAVRVLTKQIT